MQPARSLRLETFAIEQDGRVLTARYTAPPHNFLTAAGSRDWDELARAVRYDGTVGAVVVTGGPRDRFITHFDIDEIAAAARLPVPPLQPWTGEIVVRAGAATLRSPGGLKAWRRFGGPLGLALETVVHLHSAALHMQKSGAVWIAAVNGPCLGGGLEFAMACDLRIVVDEPETVFGQPEILGGIIPGGGGTQHLTRLVGTGRAIEMILEGNSIGPAEALKEGLIHRAVPRADLLPDALAWAERLSRRSSEAVAAAKQSVYFGPRRRPRAALYGEAGGLVSGALAPLSKRLALTYAEDVARLHDSPFIADPARWLSGDVALGPEQVVLPKL